MNSKFVNSFFLSVIFLSTYVFSATNEQDKTILALATISWDSVSTDTLGNSEVGPLFYSIYCDTMPYFYPGESNFLVATMATSYTHQLPVDRNYYYIITATDEYGNTSAYSETVGTTFSLLLQLSAFLEGSYDVTGDSMTTTYSKNSILPLVSPYPESARELTEIPADIVDWVLVVLEDPVSRLPVDSKSFLLNKSGQVVELDGTTTTLSFPGIASGEYYITLKHRNHLGVTSNQPLALSTTATTVHDFTISESNSMGVSSVKQLVVGQSIYGLWAGDVDQDDHITSTDYVDTWNTFVAGASGYQNADVNLDSQININDYFKWLNNCLKGL